MNNRLINTKVAGGGGGCTDIVDNYDPFGGNGVALYQLNGNGVDLSGNYSANSTNNVTWVNGVFGQAAQFNGSNAIIDTPVIPITNTTTFTNSSWVYISSLSIGNIIAFAQTSSVNSIAFISIAIRPSSNNVELVRKDSTDVGLVSYAPYAWSVGWHHVVWVCTPTNSKLYVNGSQIADTDYTQTSPLSFTTQSIGGRLRPAQMFYAEGVIDQNRFFNTALTPLEVEALYTEELCICDGTVDTLDILGDGSCIATYPLDGNANDLSGNYSGTPTDVSYGVGEFDLAGNFKALQGNIVTPVGVYSNSFSGHSVSFWMYSGGTDYETPIWTRTAAIAAAGWGIRVGIGGNSLTWFWQNAANSFVFVAEITGTFTDGWHHVVASWDGTTNTNGAKLYVDKNLSSQLTANATLASQTFSLGLTLGADRQSAGRSIQGLDQVRIFNKALNQTEVDTLFAESACTYGGRQSEGTQILGDTSCIAYYKLDGTADDETGTYNGTFTTPNYENGEFLYSAVFNGSTSAINTTYTPTVANLRTVSLWFKGGQQSSYKNLFSVGPYGSSNNYWWAYAFLLADGRISGGYGANNGGVVYVKATNGTYDDNLWHHLVITFNGVYGTGSSVDMYVDNVLITTTPNTANNTSISAVTGTFRLGHVVQAGGNYQILDGSIDQVRVFDRELTSGEVTTLYNEGI